MRGRTRRVGIAVVLAAVAALSSSCSGTPSAVGPCHHVVAYPHDGGYVAAFDWDDNLHAYGESVPVTVCISGAGADTATFQGLSGVTADPTQQPIEASVALTVLTFNITVEKGGQGKLRFSLQTNEGHLFAQPGGPMVTPSGDGWRFTSPDLS